MDTMLPDELDGLLELAAAIAVGDTDRLQASARRVLDTTISPTAVDELILQSVLTVGWPRALVAAGIWRRAIGEPATPSAEPDLPDLETRARRGEAVYRTIYGPQYERLRHNVQAMHPALDSWMLVDGYGRTLARAGLALAARELCTVAQTVALRTPAQLHSHLLGALRAGATSADIDAAVVSGCDVLAEVDRAAPRQLWQRVLASWNAT